MKIIKGIPVSPGIAIGKALIRQKVTYSINKKEISVADSIKERERFHNAVNEELAEFDNYINNLAQSDEDKALLLTHKGILQDPDFVTKVTDLIDTKSYAVEYALHTILTELSSVFGNMSNPMMAERIIDFDDVITKLISRLSGNSNSIFEDDIFKDINTPSVILIMDDIVPSDVSKSYHTNVAAICLQKGSKTSHTSIIARAIGLPVVVGISDLFKYIENNDTVIVDGNSGNLIIAPDDTVLQKYEEMLTAELSDQKELDKFIKLPTITEDGKELKMLCNIELEEEINTLLEHNGDGIGLFRTEFMYIEKDVLPTEDEQYHIYSNLAKKLQHRVLTIRTFDLGGDKLTKVIPAPPEVNPFLGSRGIRFSFRYPDLFKTQIKAILRANVYGNIAVMFPMIATVNDMLTATKIVEDCKNELKHKEIPFNPDLKLGAMIEIPSAALCSDELAKVCDFFSIGTNDLVQYTMASDRNSELVADFYDPYHPAVMKLIAMTVNNAHKYGVSVSICGEIASECDFICVLVGLNIDALSVNPNVLLSVKKQLKSCNYEEAKKMVKKILKAPTGNAVKELIDKYRKYCHL